MKKSQLKQIIQEVLRENYEGPGPWDYFDDDLKSEVYMTQLPQHEDKPDYTTSGGRMLHMELLDVANLDDPSYERVKKLRRKIDQFGGSTNDKIMLKTAFEEEFKFSGMQGKAWDYYK